MKSASFRHRTTLVLTLMRAKLAAGRARDEAPDAGQCKGRLVLGSTASGGDNRIITAGKDQRNTSARVLTAVLISISLAAILGSGPALRWTETLPESRLTTALHDAATRWNETLSALGASWLHDWLRAKIRAFEAVHF